MVSESIARAVSLAQSLGKVIIATSAPDRTPHVAVARKIALHGDDTVAVDEWFCPGTVENAQPGATISLVIWDDRQDKGWQLLGTVLGVEDRAMLNGFTPEEVTVHVPQVLRTLRVRISKALAFTQAPHDDREA